MLELVKRERFVAKPVGCYFAGRTFLVWCASPTLSGTIIWGAPDARDAREMVGAWDYGLHLTGYDVVLDAGELRWIDNAGLEVISSYLRPHVERYAKDVRRQVLIVPRATLAGSVIAGMGVVIDIRHQWRTFTDEGEGLAWLEREDAAPAYVEVHRLVAETQALTATLIAVRDYLVQHLRGASIESASHALGHSPRSLQRHLQQHQSSFREELRRARIQQGARLLAGSDLKLEAVAKEVGYTSSSHFARAFFEETGEEPLGYRQIRRG